MRFIDWPQSPHDSAQSEFRLTTATLAAPLASSSREPPFAVRARNTQDFWLDDPLVEPDPDGYWSVGQI